MTKYVKRSPAVTPLAVWMDRRGVTNRQLAAAVGYHQSLVWKMRVGLRQPSSSFKLALAKAYGQTAAHELFPADFPAPEVGA